LFRPYNFEVPQITLHYSLLSKQVIIMILLQLYVRMSLAMLIALWGMVIITRLFYLDWNPCQQVEQVTVLSTAMQAESTPIPTIARDVPCVGLRRQQQTTTLHEDGQLPSPILSGKLTENTSNSDDAPAALPRKHQSPQTAPPPPSLRDGLSPSSGKLTENTPIRDNASASPPSNHQSPKQPHELYKVDDDGRFVIVHRYNVSPSHSNRLFRYCWSRCFSHTIFIRRSCMYRSKTVPTAEMQPSLRL
jgi:hypothetical protein